jgi:uncharacterized protein YqgV (UPF0045/DUF77 family)
VARAIEEIQQTKIIEYQLSVMVTLVEAELYEIFETVKKMYEAVFGKDIKRA